MLQPSRLAHGVARAEQAEGQDARRRRCRRRAGWQQIIWACCSLLECSCKPCSLVPSTSRTWLCLVGALASLEVATSSAASFPTSASLSASICHQQETHAEHTIGKTDKTGQRARATETGRETGGRAAAGVRNLFDFSQRLAFGVRRDDGSLRLAFQLLAFPFTLPLDLSAMQDAPQQTCKLQESSTARQGESRIPMHTRTGQQRLQPALSLSCRPVPETARLAAGPSGPCAPRMQMSCVHSTPFFPQGQTSQSPDQTHDTRDMTLTQARAQASLTQRQWSKKRRRASGTT